MVLPLGREQNNPATLRRALGRPGAGGLLAQPLQMRRELAIQARAASLAHQQSITMAIMDVAPTAVAELFNVLKSPENKAPVLLHGHTHRPGIHASQAGTRVVLGDWRAQQPSYLRVENKQGLLVAHGRSWIQDLA